MIVVDILQLGDFNSGGELSHKGTGPLWLRGHRPGIYGGSYSNLEEFTGQLVQYVPSWYQKPCLSLADVPAHMKYRSIELVIGDLQATTPGAVASGGGGLKGLCYCTGSQWRVIGPA
jgi:hypothetical protein